MQDDLLGKIAAVTKELGVSELAKGAMISLACDPHGIERIAAPSMLASSLDVTIDKANEAIVELLAKSLVREKDGNPPRLEVDYSHLGLDDQEIITLRSRRTVFVNHGAPHSEAAMKSLDRFFRESVSPIFVALEVTSPSIFKGLKERAKSGRLTTYLMPRKRDLPAHRRTHYAEMKKSWVRYFLSEESDVRKNTELRVTEIPFRDLYTSALSNDLARFDLHFLDSGTTRDGDILEVKRGTTLYEAIEARYAEAVERSCPLWRVWWWKALAFWFKRTILPFLLLGIGLIFASHTSPYAAVTSTIALGLLVNLIFKNTGLDSWYRRPLFGK